MRFTLLIPAVACLALAGCTKKPLPPETDPAKGREVLAAVLGTWKRGGTTDELKSASPAVAVRDPDWEAGHKLTSYEIDPEDGRKGVDLMLSVKLTLARADGKTQEKKVRYVVAVAGATVVLRDE